VNVGDLTEESFFDVLRRLRRLELAVGLGEDRPRSLPLRCSAQVVVDSQALQCDWYGNERKHHGSHVVVVDAHRIEWHQSPIDRENC
jgi:hypothetical protein